MFLVGLTMAHNFYLLQNFSFIEKCWCKRNNGHLSVSTDDLFQKHLQTFVHASCRKIRYKQIDWNNHRLVKYLKSHKIISLYIIKAICEYSCKTKHAVSRFHELVLCASVIREFLMKSKWVPSQAAAKGCAVCQLSSNYACSIGKCIS